MNITITVNSRYLGEGGGREGEREGERKGGREKGREGEREGGRKGWRGITLFERKVSENTRY